MTFNDHHNDSLKVPDMTNQTTPSERELFDGYRWRFKEGKDRTWRYVERMPGFDPSIVESEPLVLAARATAKRETLTESQIIDRYFQLYDADKCASTAAYFREGVRFAEQHHGIGVTK